MYEHEELTSEEHRIKQNLCLDIAQVMLRNGKHYGTLLALTDAADHFAQAGYLDNLASARAEGDFDHEPIRACVACTIKWMSEAVYLSVAREKADEVSGRDE